VRPDVVVGADIVAGFPAEADAMFENTLSFIAEAGLTFLHVFPYSEREGTPAARMPPVPVGVRKERAARLREVGNRQVAALVEAQRGQETMLVMEKPREGRSPHYLMVTVDDPQPVGALVPVRMSGVSEEGVLMARTLDAQAAA